METHGDDARELLREADRAEAAPWVDFPPTPRWYPPMVGLWGAGLVVVLGVLDGFAAVVGLLVLVAVVGAFAGWYRGYRGAMPKGGMPAEFRRPAAAFIGAQLLLFGVATYAALNGFAWPAALVVLVIETVLVAWYERAYADAARATKARLA